MSEIEKMYENAGVDKRAYYDSCPKGQHLSNNLTCYECEYFSTETPYLKCSYRVYPPFTAEKQLELIKWLCQNTYRNYIHFRYERDINNWKMECNMIGLREYGSFEECFAGLINNLWQDLTEEEKQEIKRILECQK